MPAFFLHLLDYYTEKVHAKSNIIWDPYKTIKLTNQARMFSGANASFYDRQGKLIHPAGAFCGCTKRQATAHRAFAKTPNNRTNVRLLYHKTYEYVRDAFKSLKPLYFVYLIFT